MGFNEDLKSFAERIIPLKDTISTEEATKMSMIIPFSNCLDMMYLTLPNFALSTQQM
jgi:hypothetical protein